MQIFKGRSGSPNFLIPWSRCRSPTKSEDSASLLVVAVSRDDVCLCKETISEHWATSQFCGHLVSDLLTSTYLPLCSLISNYSWLHYVSKKFTLYLCDNFPKCKPIQIIFGRNIARRVLNKVTVEIFNTVSLLVICSAICIHRMDIIRNVYIVWLQILLSHMIIVHSS